MNFMVFKDLYKVIVSDIPKVIDQQIGIDLFFMNSKGELVRMNSADVIAKGTAEASILALTFEYEEY